MPFTPTHALAAVPLALGVLTHILWDSFTHYNRLGTKLFPELSQPVTHAFGYTLRLCNVLQYASSAIGLPILLVVIARWYTRQPITGAPVVAASAARRWLTAALFIGVPLAMLALAMPRFEVHANLVKLAYEVTTRTIAMYMIGAVALTLPFRVRFAEARAR